MTKVTLLALALAIPATVTAAEQDSVYTWGAWAQNIQPAAGPRTEVAPAAVSQPRVNFRPNENAAFNRAATPATVPPSNTQLITGVGVSPTSQIDVNATPGL